MRGLNYKDAILKAAIVLIPSYAAAYFTGEMVWVVPTLAATSFFAANISTSDLTTKRLDEDGDDDGGDNGDDMNIDEADGT